MAKKKDRKEGPEVRLARALALLRVFVDQETEDMPCAEQRRHAVDDARQLLAEEDA